jgi:hypothetical protein
VLVNRRIVVLLNHEEEATAFPPSISVGIHVLGLKRMRSVKVSRRDDGITVATQIVIETYATGLDHTQDVHGTTVTARAYTRATPGDWFGGYSFSQRQRKRRRRLGARKQKDAMFGNRDGAPPVQQHFIGRRRVRKNGRRKFVRVRVEIQQRLSQSTHHVVAVAQQVRIKDIVISKLFLSITPLRRTTKGSRRMGNVAIDENAWNRFG